MYMSYWNGMQFEYYVAYASRCACQVLRRMQRMTRSIEGGVTDNTHGLDNGEGQNDRAMGDRLRQRILFGFSRD